jgi:hypothetical protein
MMGLPQRIGERAVSTHATHVWLGAEEQLVRRLGFLACCWQPIAQAGRMFEGHTPLDRWQGSGMVHRAGHVIERFDQRFCGTVLLRCIAH